MKPCCKALTVGQWPDPPSYQRPKMFNHKCDSLLVFKYFTIHLQQSVGICNKVFEFERKYVHVLIYSKSTVSRNLMMGRRWHFAVKEAEERRGGQKRMLTGNDTKQNSSNRTSLHLLMFVRAGKFWPTDMWLHQSPFDEGQLERASHEANSHLNFFISIPRIFFHSISIPYLPFLSPSSAYRSWLRNAPIYQVRHFWQ